MSRLFTFSFVAISILSIFFGFLFNEDLSTGGAKFDFHITLNAIKELSNLSFKDFSVYTRHFPLHYILLSIPYGFLNDDYVLRIIYLIFSFLLPAFFYLNLKQIYNDQKTNILLICFSLLFLPFFRSSSFWANSHLTALIFLLIGNLFYLKSFKEKKIYKYLNLFFLSLATYSLQSYAIFYAFYLFQYYNNSTIKEFIFILFFCILLAIPGFVFILSEVGARSFYSIGFSKDISYSLITNFSIIFFYYCFLIFNKESFMVLKTSFCETKKMELGILILLFFICVYFFDYKQLSGGGFFYKISKLTFNNNLIFFLSSFLGMLITLLIIKKEFKFLYIIILINIMSSHNYVFQKYFEPIFILLIFVLFKNFLSNNILNFKKNTLVYLFIILGYFLIASLNLIFGISKNLATSL